MDWFFLNSSLNLYLKNVASPLKKIFYASSFTWTHSLFFFSLIFFFQTNVIPPSQKKLVNPLTFFSHLFHFLLISFLSCNWPFFFFLVSIFFLFWCCPLLPFWMRVCQCFLTCSCKPSLNGVFFPFLSDHHFPFQINPTHSSSIFLFWWVFLFSLPLSLQLLAGCHNFLFQNDPFLSHACSISFPYGARGILCKTNNKNNKREIKIQIKEN